MASSYSTDLKLELMVTGENAGTWGDNTNNNLNTKTNSTNKLSPKHVYKSWKKREQASKANMADDRE